MLCRFSSLIVLFLLVISIVDLYLVFSSSIRSRVIYVPDDYPSIQAAIIVADHGDTIIVRDGIYNEWIIIDKSIVLRSENGPENCIMDGKGFGDAIEIVADNVVIEGFTIRNYSTGIRILSNNNIIKNNIIQNNDDGIRTLSSNNNVIMNNNIVDNKYSGIYMDSSNNNDIMYNNVTNNGYGIIMSLSNNNDIKYNNIIDTEWDGISMVSSNNSVIMYNNIISNANGILMYSSNNNVIMSNNITYNRVGISIGRSRNNIIYFNNFIGNNIHVISWGSNNTWYSLTEINYTYNGSIYSGFIGNYWDNYNGTDFDGDGIGDTFYVITVSRIDYYPLIKPIENYELLNHTIPKPDLVVEDIVVKAGGGYDESYIVSIVIGNVGDMGASLFNVSLYVNNSIIGVSTGDYLGVGEKTIINFTWTPSSPGAYVLNAIVDPDNIIDEIDEDNNVFIKTFVVELVKSISSNISSARNNVDPNVTTIESIYSVFDPISFIVIVVVVVGLALVIYVFIRKWTRSKT